MAYLLRYNAQVSIAAQYSRKWPAGLDAALKNGAILPAVAAAIFSGGFASRLP
jgi:hypothetical protein